MIRLTRGSGRPAARARAEPVTSESKRATIALRASGALAVLESQQTGSSLRQARRSSCAVRSRAKRAQTDILDRSTGRGLDE